MKKVILAIVALVVVAGGVFLFLNAKDTYDKTKYSATITPKPLQVGSQVEFTLPDQFDKAHSLESGTKTLILTFAKESSHVVRNFLKTKSDDYLLTHEANYIADIHPMPTVIRNLFAMPDLQKSNYPVILIYEEEIANLFKDPTHSDDIMIVTLNQQKVTKIDFVKDAKALETKLEQ